MIYYEAHNNSTYMTGARRVAKSMRSAVIAARSFLDNNLYGEGVINYFDAQDAEWPIRVDEKGLHTGYRMVTRKGDEI